MANRRRRQRGQNNSPPPPPEPYESIWGWASNPERQLWALGLLPFLVAGLSLLITAHGDLTTLSELIRSSTTSQLVFGAVLPLIPAALLVVPSIWLERIYYKDPVPKRTTEMMLAISLIAFLSLPSAVFSAGLLLYTLMFGFVLLEKHAFKSEGEVRVFGPVQLLVVAISMWPLLNSYLTPEVIELQNQAEKYTSAYVLSSDSDWTKLLSTGGGITVVPTKDITSRQPCHRNRPAPGSAYERLFGSQRANPNCEDLLRDKRDTPVTPPQAPTTPRETSTTPAKPTR